MQLPSQITLPGSRNSVKVQRVEQSSKNTLKTQTVSSRSIFSHMPGLPWRFSTCTTTLSGFIRLYGRLRRWLRA